MMTIRRASITASIGALLITALLAGCSSSNRGMSEADTQMSADMSTGIPFDGELHTIEEGAALDQYDLDSTNSDSVSPSAQEVAVIQTGSLTVESEEPSATADAIIQLVQDSGGSVESRSIHTDPNTHTAWGESASLVLRVPETEFNETIEQIQETTDVVSVSQSAHDVTTQKVDLQARVSSLATSIQRLESLLAEADNVSDLIEVESALSERQANFDSLAAQLEVLESQVAFSTLYVDVLTSGSTPIDGPQNFWEALLAGLASIGTAFAATVIGLGYALPWIIALGVVAAVIITIVVSTRRRRTRQAAQTQHPQV